MTKITALGVENSLGMYGNLIDILIPFKNIQSQYGLAKSATIFLKQKNP